MHIPKRYFFQLNYIQRDQWVWERSCFSDSNSVLTRLPCCFSKGPLKLGFLDIYLATYLRVSNFGNTSAMSVILVGKRSKFNLNFKNAEKNCKKCFCFWNNFIWIGCVKVSLLIREYFSFAVNLLTNNLKILHITKIDVYLQSDQ